MSALPELPERQRARLGDGHTHASKSNDKPTSFTSSGNRSSQSPLAVNIGDVNNLLKLRTKFEFTRLSDRLPKRLVGHFGADLNVQQQSVMPAVALRYEIIKDDKDFGFLQADTSGVSYRRPISIKKRDFSCKVAPKAGYSWQGRANVGLDIGSLKPKWAAVAFGLGILATGRPIGGSLRLPDNSSLTLNVPGVKVPGLAQGEIAASIQRTKRGVSLNIEQLNGILSL